MVDWAPSGAEGDKVPYVFDGGEPSPDELSEIKLAPDELPAAEFHSARDLDQLLIPRPARRVKAAVTARAEAHPMYLEHGRPPKDERGCDTH